MLPPPRLRASSSSSDDDSLHVVTEARLSAGVLTWEAHDEQWWDFVRDEAHEQWEDEREAVGTRALRAHFGCDPSQAAAEALTYFAEGGPGFDNGVYEYDEGSRPFTADERETAADHARTLVECGAFEPVLDAIGREGALLAQVGEEHDDYVYPDDYAGTQALMEVARDHARSRELYRQVPAPAVRVRSLCPSRRLDRRLSGGRPSRRRATRATASSSRDGPSDEPDPPGSSPLAAGRLVVA